MAAEGFSPNPETEEIIYAFKGLKGVGSAEIEEIILNRPYKDFDDFINKTKIKKPSIISLIKAGAFDDIENISRTDIMKKYIMKISDPKETLNMRNFSALIKRNLLPEELDLQKRTFNFFKYIKQKEFKYGEDRYILNNRAVSFLEKEYPGYEEYCEISDDNIIMNTSRWKKKVYDPSMIIAKDYIKEHLETLLINFNKIQFNETWNKYCLGTISKWEMDSMGFYFHEHELSNINLSKYQISTYENLPEIPRIERTFTIKGREIPIFEINKIIGTVISKNNISKSFSLLTIQGSVVNVKLSDEYYALFNKQISEEVNGVKKVKEKSWFNSGNKVLLVGFRREDSFVLKRYKNTIDQHRLYLITDILENGDIIYTSERYGMGEENNGV